MNFIWFLLVLAHQSWKLKWDFRPSVCNLFTFSSSFPEPLGQFQPNLAQSILEWVNSSLSLSLPCPFPMGDNYEIAKIHWQIKKILLLNQWTNFNQTWQKACMLGWRGFKFVQIEEPRLFPKGDDNKIAKIHSRIWKSTGPISW